MEHDLNDDALAFIKTLRTHEIRVTSDGKLTVWFPVSEEYAAKCLHDLLRAKKE